MYARQYVRAAAKAVFVLSGWIRRFIFLSACWGLIYSLMLCCRFRTGGAGRGQRKAVYLLGAKVRDREVRDRKE
jgi:hypothetical protein